jgi:predicted glycosyltransferase
MNILIVVTHLLGTGHLARALTLARAFQDAGDRVTVISGGVPVPNLDLGDIPIVQLPPVRSDGVNFSQLLTSTGDTMSDDYLERRQSILLETLQTVQPDVLITELYPFGRRILQAEFSALLDAAQHVQDRPVICASIRDILAPPSKPKKAEATHAILAAHYDSVLVHSDEDLMPLDLSWPVSDALRSKLVYTGFVAPPAPAPHPNQEGKGEILVSAGGGDVGQPLFKATLHTAHLMPHHHFRLLVGGTNRDQTCTQLLQDAAPNVSVEPARPDFRQMLNHAAASISLCGYNTALDILQTGCPAVFMPYDAGSEVEQSIRASGLAAHAGIAMIKGADLTPENLQRALQDVLNAPARQPVTKNTNGATQTRHILYNLVHESR